MSTVQYICPITELQLETYLERVTDMELVADSTDTTPR